jgi:hypothetical protein
MNGFAWAMLIFAGMVGALLFVTIGAILLALLLANVSDRLARNDDDHRD